MERFSALSPGSHMFCLVKTVRNFGILSITVKYSTLTWSPTLGYELELLSSIMQLSTFTSLISCVSSQVFYARTQSHMRSGGGDSCCY